MPSVPEPVPVSYKNVKNNILILPSVNRPNIFFLNLEFKFKLPFESFVAKSFNVAFNPPPSESAATFAFTFSFDNHRLGIELVNDSCVEVVADATEKY